MIYGDYRLRTLRAKPVNSYARPVGGSFQQPSSAPYWELQQTYEVGSVYMTSDQLRNLMEQNVRKAVAQQNLQVYSYTIIKEWAVWQGLWTDYYITYDVIVGSPQSSALSQGSFQPWVALAVIVILALAVAGLVIVFFIVKTGQDTINALMNWVPTSLRPAVSTIILVGGAIAAAGVGLGLVLLAVRRRG
jgi:hypothetical protein